MWDFLRTMLCSAISALKLRRDLAFENLALRQQLTVLKRQSKKAASEGSRSALLDWPAACLARLAHSAPSC